MKVAAYILWFSALGLLCVAAWGLFTGQGLWGYSHLRLANFATMIASVLIICASFLLPRRRQQGVGRLGRFIGLAKPGSREWTTAGGVGVILVTGLVAIGDGSGFLDGSPVNAVLGILVIVLTLGGAFALHRFIARHGDDIGEARFDTRNPDESRP